MDKLKKLEESELGKKFERLKELHEAYNRAVAKQNQIIDVIDRIDRNQFDRQIIHFATSVSSCGVTDGEWRTIVTIGLKETVSQIENQVSNIARSINEIVRVE